MAPREATLSDAVAAERSTQPARAGLVLAALIAAAAVANLGLAVANVALPSIAKHFEASQVSLNLVAVGYSLALAASVLYFSCGPWVNTRTQQTAARRWGN